MTTLVKGCHETLFWFLSVRRKLPFLLLTVNRMKHSFRLIMALDLHLTLFSLGLWGNLFILFIIQQMNSVQPTRVACFAGVFPFRPSMNDNEMVTPISFKWKGKPIKQHRKTSNGTVFEEFNCLFCYPLVCKFLSCLSLKKWE